MLLSRRLQDGKKESCRMLPGKLSRSSFSCFSQRSTQSRIFPYLQHSASKSSDISTEKKQRRLSYDLAHDRNVPRNHWYSTAHRL
jgi:hypothetical protein